MERNVKIAYFLSFAFHSWFWMGNWIFYYLMFGDYSTVAMIDSVALIFGVIYEIPTGAFADLVGKKKTLILAFLFQTIGNVLMGFASSALMLAGSVWIFICLAYAFYSGTMEAMLYDSLKEIGKEGDFDKKNGSLGAVRLLSMAVCGVIGGYAYTYMPSAPYLLAGIMSGLGFLASFWLVEPKVDTDKYSLRDFFVQNTKGLKILFSSNSFKNITWYLVVTGAMATFIYNLLDDLLAVEFGYSPTTISILFSVACLVSGIFTYLVPRLKTKIDTKWWLVVPMIVMAVAIMLSPFISMFIFGILMMIRVIGEAIYQNYTSVVVNGRVESSVRATTLSSLALLRNIPYGLLGTFVGAAVIFSGGARNFSMYYGITLLILTLWFGWKLRKINNV